LREKLPYHLFRIPMNYAVDVDHRDAKQVVREFLAQVKE